MDILLKIVFSKLFIAFLTLVALSSFLYIYFDNKEKNNQTLVTDKKYIQVKLLELKSPPPDFYIKIQDVNNQQIYDDVFVSKLCPLYEKNQQGQLMNIYKVNLLQIKENIQIINFEGLYEYMCTDKKDNEEKNKKNEK